MARVFLISSSLGPLVLMIYRMVHDMGKWLQYKDVHAVYHTQFT